MGWGRHGEGLAAGGLGVGPGQGGTWILSWGGPQARPHLARDPPSCCPLCLSHLLSSQYVERHFSREGTTQHSTVSASAGTGARGGREVLFLWLCGHRYRDRWLLEMGSWAWPLGTFPLS